MIDLFGNTGRRVPRTINAPYKNHQTQRLTHIFTRPLTNITKYCRHIEYVCL